MIKVGDKVFLHTKDNIGWEIESYRNIDILARDYIFVNEFYTVTCVEGTDKIAICGKRWAQMYWHHPEHFKKYTDV